MSATDFVLSTVANYGSAIKDMPSFIALANDFKRSGNILGKYDIVTRNGKQYIIFKGNPRLRRIIKGTKYLLNNTQFINIGLGKQGVRSGAIGGFYIAVFFSITLDTVNWIFKDNYRWTNWLGTVSTDIVKSVIGVLASVVWGGMVAGASSIALTLFGGIVIGLIVGGVLTYLDERFHVTDSIIKFLNHVDKKAPLLVNEFYKAHITEIGEVKNFMKSNIDKIGRFYSSATAQGLMF